METVVHRQVMEYVFYDDGDDDVYDNDDAVVAVAVESDKVNVL